MTPNRRRRRIGKRFVVIAALAAALVALGPGPASAQGDCTAMVGGRDLASARSHGDAITVGADDAVELVAISPVEVRHVTVATEIGPFHAALFDANVPPGGAWSDSVAVSDIAGLGVGLYSLEISTDSGCSIEGWVKITGRSPFTTVAGILAAVVLAAGIALQGVGLAAVRGGRGRKWVAALGGIPTGVGACVLAQQFGQVPVTSEWLAAFGAFPVAIGGIGARFASPSPRRMDIATSDEDRLELGGGPMGPRPVPSDAGDAAAAPPPATAAPRGPAGPRRDVPDAGRHGAAMGPLPVPSDAGDVAAAPAPATAAPRGPAGPRRDVPDVERHEAEMRPFTIDEPPPPEPTTAEPPPSAVGDDQAIPADPPRSAHALVKCDSVAIAGRPFPVEIGIAARPTEGVISAEMHRPATSVGPYVLSVEVIAEGFALPPGAVVRNDLHVTVEQPYPSFTLQLVPETPEEARVKRSLHVIYSVDGQTIGVAYRPIEVAVSAEAAAGLPETPVTEGVDMSVPTDRTPPDLTMRIVIPDSERDGRLRVSLDSPHEIALPASLTVDVGDEPDVYARQLVERVGGREGQVGLYEFLLGTGRDIARQLPNEFWSALAAVAGRVGGRPPTILILSEEPYIPWELAVLDAPLDQSLPPFLSAQADVGRWILAERGPKLPPPTEVRITSSAVVCGSYIGPEGQPLAEAEEEARLMREMYAAAAVNADMREVLDCLKGNPKAELLHFAVHGRYEPSGASDGLALVDGTALAPEQIRSRSLASGPFVFLNACQVGSGAKVLGDYSGIAAAFVYAGASGVVAPLWSVQDHIARDIALRFYESVFSGIPPAAAFRSERQRFVDSPDTTSSISLAYQFFGHPALKIRREQS